MPDLAPASVEPTSVDTDVIVVGGGPVGLTLAHELGSRGVDVLLVEPRTQPDMSSPRCKQLNPRSMEHLRRLGLADAVRDASLLPFGWSDAAVFCTSLTGAPIARFEGVFALSDVPSSELPEPAQWTAQFRVEAALRAALTERPTVRARWGSRLTGLEQDERHVLVTVCDADGTSSRVRGRYLVGADGGRGSTRRLLGIGLSGSSGEIKNLQVIFDAPGLAERHPHGRAVQYWTLNPGASGLLGQLDTAESWWAIVIGAPTDADPAWTEQALHGMLGAQLPIRVRSQDPWTARMLLADRYRAGRCFLAGDAAHLNPPWGGFGANTGIGDAVDLGWKLAAQLHGWAGPGLLESYQTERRPVAAQAITEAERNMAVLTPQLRRPGLEGDAPSAVAARAAAAQAVRRAKVAELYTLDFVLGAGCPESPLVVPDDRGGDGVHRAVPGRRLPHLWLRRGESLYDRLGSGLTLLELGAPSAPAGWRAAARQRGVPLRVLPLERPDAARRFGACYLLVRPDHLVAWCGDQLPADPAELFDQVRGASWLRR